MSRRALTLGVALLLLNASVGLAEEVEDDFSRKGPYAMVMGGWSLENFNNNSNSDSDGGWTVGGAWGYRTHPNIAADIRFFWVDRMDMYRDRSFDVTQVIEESVQIFHVTATGKVYYPLDRFQPYLSVGLGFLSGDFDGVNVDRELGFTTLVGGGADIYATPNFALNLNIEYMLPVSQAVSDLQYAQFTAGILWRY